MEKSNSLRRTIALFLAILLGLQVVGENTSISFAENNEAATVTMYGDNGSGAVDLATDKNAQFEYGMPITLSLSGVNVDAKDKVEYYIKTGNAEDEPYNSTTIYEPGLYKLGYYIIDENDEIIKQDTTFTNYAFTIVAELGVPSDLRWDGTKAVWDTLKTDKNGKNLKEGTVCNYTVTLYKNGEEVTGQEKEVTGTDAESQSFDFGEVITSAYGGKGKYTFSVKATVPDSLADYYKASADSPQNTSELYAVEVTLDKKQGISSATVKPDTDTAFLLIAGDARYNSKEISATAASGWNFGSWSVDGESGSISGFSFDSASNDDAKITIADAYSGSTEVKVIANPQESNAPTISAYKVGTGENKGKLVATALDDQSGLKAYAFSTADAAEKVGESEWKVLDNATVGAQTVTFTPTASGKYYFYAKDADGNISGTSGMEESTEGIEKAIPVTVIAYADYYENNEKVSTKKDVYIGSASYTLPSLTDTDEVVHRKGYVFDGWYTAADFSGEAVSSLSGNLTTDVTVYAKWTLTELTWATGLENIEETEVTYTGENVPLIVKVNDTTADVTYIWYKKDGEEFKKIEFVTSETLNIRNVSDSGEYRVDAKITYTDDAGVLREKTLTGTPVTFTIKKADLTVTADIIHVTYGDEAPAQSQYTVTYDNLLGEDQTKALITEGSLSCEYKQGDSCKYDEEGNLTGYAITIDKDTFSSMNDTITANYNITTQDGTLIVDPKDVEADDTTVTVTLDDTITYTYNGSPVIPTITIQDGEDAIDPSNYTISYDDNTSAGTHTATVTFKGNYTGVVTKNFTISQKGDYDPTVMIEGWDYGESANSPYISNTIPYENPEITYYYLTGEVSDLSEAEGSTVQPVNAGNYTVYATVKDPEGNYAEKRTVPYTFIISPRTIILIAGSETWEYDGNFHSYDSYTIKDKDGNTLTEDQVFVLPTESFQSIKVTGSVTDVNLDENGNNIGQKNTVSYTLTSVTNEDNYNIQCVDGTLKITPTRLPSPANLQWDNANPGTATWVAVSRSGLVVNYKVELYMHDGASAEGEDLLIATKETQNSETSVNFADDIHGQISTGSKKSFYFKVQAIASGSIEEGKKVQDDYMDSEMSEPSASIYTATIYLTKKLCDAETASEQEGLESIGFTDPSYEGWDAVTLIAGESFTANAVAKAGYEFTYRATCSHGVTYTPVWHPTKPEYSQYFMSSYDAFGSSVTVTVKPNLTESLTDVYMTASVADSSPFYRNFKAENKADNSAVTFSIELMDELGIKRWRLEKVEEKTITYEDGSTYTYYDTVKVYDWKSFKKDDGTYPANVYVPASIDIQESGTYRIQYSDAESGESRVYPTNEAFTVYEIQFGKGDTDDEIHTMNPIYKLANTEITLPACVFTKTGYSFQNWSGAATGISVDRAVFKANANDTLVANWTNDQYTYTVKYYYMNADGTYSTEPSETETFTGKYGDVIVASTDGTDIATESIQKPKNNYSNDANPNGVIDYNNTITLTGPDQVLRIYYKTGSYTITYKYTLPGAISPTEIPCPYNYGAAITELEKPQMDGYDFVGWVYEGYGSAPETMPAKNITATGRFVAKSAKYQVVYHLETLGSGENHTEVYEVDVSRTQSFNSKQDEIIKAYLTKGSDLATNEIEGTVIDGFTLKGVVVSYGTASNAGEGTEDGLPDGTITAEGEYAEGKVTCDTANTLYINYYYTRNEYNLTLEVWKESRESDSNRLYQKAQVCQYGEDISSLAAQYQENSYYIDADGRSKLEGFTMPAGYKFASYTDFSTGMAPTTMPAGDVTVTRDVILADKTTYQIEIYFEKSEIGTFDYMTTLNYQAAEGTKVQIVGDGDPQEDADCTYLNYNTFIKTLPNYKYYQHVSLDGLSAEYGTVKADETLVLKVYFERITTKATIQYYYGNSQTGKNTEFATFTIEGKWGEQYEFDPTALFYKNTSEDWFNNEDSVYKKYNLENVTVKNIKDSDGVIQDGLNYDFKSNSYLVSYQCFYRYFNSSTSSNPDAESWVYPSHTFTKVSSAPKCYDTGYGANNREPEDAGLKDTITCYFGIKDDTRCYIYYNQIVEDNDFYLDVRLNYSNLNDQEDVDRDNVPDWYKGTEKNGNQAVTKLYKDSTTTRYIPITYPYDFNGNGTIDADEYYQLRIMNKCAIVQVDFNYSSSGDEYPAANAKERQYTYTGSESLYPGFTRIEGTSGTTEYYFYYPGAEGVTEETKLALGTEPCVFLADTKDRFMQGAYVGFSQGNGTDAYAQAKAFLDAYQAAHADDVSPAPPKADPSATALAFSTTSYGSTYVYGERGYLTYSFYYHDECKLQFSYNGNLCEHSYVFGKTVSKDEVNCQDIETAPEGYVLVWYLDQACTQPIPEDGLVMNRDIPVYGRMEKKTIPNMEYIYYELADPIQVGGKIYRYVTQDNLDILQKAGKAINKDASQIVNIDVDNGHGGTVSKPCVITTYKYDDAIVMVSIERPTVSFTELKLAKDTVEYTDYYGKDYQEAYGMDGFYYDETNTGNRSYGYVNTTPINLKVYFARDKYQVEVMTNVSEDSNPEYYTFSIDQKVQLDTPVKNGYDFAGWSWQKQVDDATWEEYTPTMTDEEGVKYFKMPGLNLKAIASWTAAEFDQTVTHYFQTASQVYDSTFISGITGTPSMTIDGVTFRAGDDTIEGSAAVYKEDETVSAVVLTTSDDDKYYFSGGKLEEESSITLQESDLVAAVTKIQVTSEAADTKADQGALTGWSMYNYSYTSYHSGKTVQSLGADSTYTPVYGMTLEYYYTRSAKRTVRILGVSTDGGESGLTCNGAGEHIYGESVNLVAALSDGYNFRGWYNAGDVLEGYPDVASPEKPLSEYPLRSDLETALSGVTAVSSDSTYRLSITENLDLVAVVKPEKIIPPDLEINGKASYTYGYEASASNALTAIASKHVYTADEVANEAERVVLNNIAAKTTVTGYQWYEITKTKDENANEVEVVTEMPGQTSSTLLISTGKNAGTYQYRCVVSYKNSDNGRTGTISMDKEIVVNKANMTVNAIGYTGVFDNLPHSITLSVSKPVSEEEYTIYYSSEKELNAENYTEGTTELPKYVDVNNNGSSACAHTTYFYILDQSGNYNSYAGSKEVNITPKEISIKALNATFSKMYDGNKEVVGEPTDGYSDMYNFANHGKNVYYALSGFVDEDTEAGTYILACDAKFNDSHVATARSFTISNLKLVYPSDGKTAYNYSFPSTTTLTFAGMITPRTLEVEWEDEENFVYNGQPQAPTVKLSDTQTYPIPPADKDYIELTVTGKQTNVGNYTAYASAGRKTGAQFNSSDYTFDDLSKDYNIVARNITIKPVYEEVTYDGTPHTNSNYQIYCGDQVDSVVSAYTLTATPVKSYTNAGTYDDMVFTNLVISDNSGKILTDNYTITYGTGTLKIESAPVKVTGITADEKNYDGTTSVTIHTTDEYGNSILTFEPLYSQGTVQDELNLDISMITGEYESSAAGTTKVNLTIPAEALTGRSKDNYVLDTVNSQKEATGNIGKSVIKLKADAVETVYGEPASFTYSTSGIIKADGTEGEGQWSDIGEVSGNVVFEINTGTKDEPVWEAYNPGTTGAGTYEIRINVQAEGQKLESANYTFEWEEDSNAVLTVKKRPVSLIALSGEDATVTKIYDGTTTVKTTPVKGKQYSFGKTTDEGGAEVSKSGVLTKDEATFNLSSSSSVYDTKDVSTASKVILTAGGLNNKNYELVNTSCDISGTITPLSLTIRAKDTTIYYGDTNPAYDVEYEDFVEVNGEQETAKTALTGTLTFCTSAYDVTDPTKRHVDTYTGDIMPGGFGAEGSVNGNYTIHYVPATLQVEPVTVYLTAQDKELRYKVGNDEDGDGNTGELPSYTFTGPDWKYPEDEARYNLNGVTLPRTESGLNEGTPIELLTIPGTYPIKIEVDTKGNVTSIEKTAGTDTYEDYIFQAVDGKLTVRKFLLTITGDLSLADKVYDGTDKIVDKPTDEAIKALFYDGVATEDEKYIGINTDALLEGSHYASKDVGESISVTLNIVLNDELSKRYELDTANTNVTATSKILRRPIEVKAKDKTIKYGDDVPTDYGIEAVTVTDPVSATNMGLVSGEALTDAYTFTAPTGYTCAYNATAGSYSPVGTYFVGLLGVTATNYTVTVKNTGVLNVVRATLVTPVPTWDETAPGTVKWEAVSGIGDVSVAGYKVELYKNGSSTAVKTIEQTTALSVNFADDIRANGGGQYTVKVTAIASTDNNADKINVADSAAGTTVKALYATKITPVFAEALDEGTLSGIGNQVDSRDPIYVKDKSSYVAIAGESDIPIKGILQNATGYTVKATADSGLTLGNVEGGGISTSGDEVSYNTTVSVATDAKPVAETKVTLTLTAREATLNAAFTVDKTSETYGFLEGSAPKFTAVATPAESDNITAEEYTYSYKWVLQPNGSTGYNDVQTGEDSIYVFPYKYDGNNYTPVGSNYRVKSYITATRKDNGVSVTTEEGAISELDPSKKYIQINIKRASYNPTIAFDPGKETWVYGTSRNLPDVSNTAGEVTENDIHLLYSKDGATWQDDMYTDVGNYKVKAHIDQTTNYDAVDTNVIEYTITQAKLDKPENVDMTASDTAPYGKITWDAVTGPKENAGASDFASEIQVKYELKLEYMPKDGNTKQQIGDAVTTSDTSYDFTDRITEAGTYYVTVRAVVDEQRNGQDALNCADSDPVTKEAFITIGAQVTSNEGSVVDGSVSKVYDGNPLTLMVEYSDGGTPSYQWMKDGQAISGATGSSISITYVEESTNFVCEITTGSSDKIYTSVVKASITPRPITITTNTDEKTYDGSALTNPGYTITSELDLATGDTITNKTMSASQTNAGSTANTISDIVITRNAGNAGEKVVYSDTNSSVKANYTITIVKGTLTVSKRPITIKAKDASKTYDGKPLTSIGENGKYSGSADAYEITSGSLVTGESIDASTLSYSGTITDVSEGPVTNTPSGTGAIIKNGDSDVTANYVITYAPGTLTIVPKPLEITAGSATKIYDGSTLTKNSYQITGGTELITGDEIESVQITGTQTYVGEAANVPTAAVIKRGNADISGNYAISYKNGTLTVEKRVITITAENKESCYGEEPKTLTYTITKPENAADMDEEDIESELRITLSCDVTSTTPVGDAYPITVSYDTTNLNYTVTPVAGTYKVTPAAITLTAQDSSVVYDKEAHSLTFTVTSPATDGVTKYYSTSNLTDEQWQTEIGKLTGGGTSDTVLTTVPSYTNAGTYTVYCYGVKENYTAGKASATLTITPKSISNSSSDITVDALSSVTYNGSAYTPAVTVRYGETLLVKGTDYDVAYANNINAGTATVTITGKGNYKDSRPVQFTINPLPVVLTWTDPADLTYDGQAKTVAAMITNQCGTDEVTVSTYTNHVKTDAGSYTASAYALGGAAKDNYTLTGAENVSHAYMITKRTLKIKTADDTKVYDGTALTKQGYSLLDGTTLADDETLAITYSGTQTNAGSSGNTVSSIAIKRGEGENEVDVTANYAITTTPGQLTVTPKPLVSGDLTMTTSDSEPYEWEYTGSEIVPTYVVKKELILGAGTVTLTENTDYTVTSDSAKTATDVGTYTITVKGTGNYSGTISVSYSIVDNTKAQITGITDGGNYCISADIEVTDPNLSEVVIKKGGTEIESFTTFTNGRLTYTIDGSGADEAGSTYTVYVKDLSAKDATGIATYHEQTYTITLYPNHKYDADQSEYTWDTGKLMGTQECKNTGDATDTIINRWGTVVWNYAYSYSTSEGVQSGTQGVEARATYAKVELLQNGNVIATQYVDCDSTCGVGGSNQDSGMDTFKFTTYDPADPTAAAGTANIPQKDENGNEYDYSLKFTIGKMSDSVFTAVNDYAYSDSADYTNPYTSSGYQRTYSYSPGCFDVPWKVVLRNLPKDEDGNMIYPSELYVKVLYAMSEDADDSETAAGYQIISQQAGTSDLGVPCTASVSGDTVVYTGSYPVWKYIGGTTDSYYHRIQVVGYKLNNEYVNVSADKLKSINDSDHVNHTIYHVNETDQASGTILYELSALLPSLVFDRNDGSTQAHAVINSVANGTVSYDDIQMVPNPIRSGYTFQGWYTQSTDGNKVTSDVNVGTLGVTLYAHWAKNAVPPQTPEENPGTDQPPVNPQNPGNQEMPETPETEPTDDGTDPNQNTGSGQASRGENPGENTPSQPGDASAAGGSEKDLAEKDNSLVVYTEHANGDNGKEAASGEAGQSAGSGNVQDNSSYLTATLPDTGAVANTVLSEEEWKLLEEGGDIAIRLTIDDTRRQEDDEKLRNFMEELLEQALSESDTKDKTVQFKSYVDLRLEKRINDADWERLYRTKEPIEIVIHIPEDMIREGETLYLAKADGSGYIMLEDLDADPNTITIMTAEFDSEYVLVSIADEETPLMLLEQDCRWHYLILIVTLLYFLVLLLTLKRKEDEEEVKAEDDNRETVDLAESRNTSKDPDDSRKKRKRNSVITRSVAQIILLLIYLYVNIRGFCEIEIPASVIGTLLILIEQMLTFRHKFKQESKRETE